MAANIERKPHLREQEIVYEVELELKELLSSVPFVSEFSAEFNDGYGPDVGYDLLLKTAANSKPYCLVIEVKSIGQPRNARMAAAQLQRMIRNFIAHRTDFKKVYGIFAAPFVSENARKICKEEGIGYIDLTGNCLISFDNIYIERFGFQKDAEKRELRSVFNDKASRIVRRLLSDPFRPWTVQELAKRSHVSIGLASQVKTKLFDSEILERRDEMLVVAKPEQLLKDWADSYRLKFKKHIAVEFYSPKKLQDIETEIIEYFKSNQTKYAFTLATAAKASGTQYVSQVNRIHAYVEGNANQIGKELGLKEVDSGGNVVLMQPFDTDILYLSQGAGLSIVSDIQLYLDFSAQKGRIQETADIIFDTKILPQWEDLRSAGQSV